MCPPTLLQMLAQPVYVSIKFHSSTSKARDSLHASSCQNQRSYTVYFYSMLALYAPFSTPNLRADIHQARGKQWDHQWPADLTSGDRTCKTRTIFSRNMALQPDRDRSLTRRRWSSGQLRDADHSVPFGSSPSRFKQLVATLTSSGGECQLQV